MGEAVSLGGFAMNALIMSGLLATSVVVGFTVPVPSTTAHTTDANGVEHEERVTAPRWPLVLGLPAIVFAASCVVAGVRIQHRLDDQDIDDEQLAALSRWALNGTHYLNMGSLENRSKWFEDWRNHVLEYLGDHFGAAYEARFTQPMADPDIWSDPDVDARTQRLRVLQVDRLHEIVQELSTNRQVRRIRYRAVVFPKNEESSSDSGSTDEPNTE